MKIDKFDLDNKILIIAEIGNNHEGSYPLAEKMIGLAADAGADAVKFQTFIPEKLVSSFDTKRIEQLSKFQLKKNDFKKLAQVAANKNVMFLSTPFDIDSVLFLKNLVPAFKISSGDNNFYPLMDAIARTWKPTIMSTGFMEIEEVKKSADFVKRIWNKNGIEQELALLHCVSVYPTLPEQANLLAIKELEHIVKTVGYSDHTVGIETAVLSVAVGARIIEKHFTIDNNYSKFHDHKLSANPLDFKKMVDRIRIVKKMMGKGKKTPNANELGNKIISRRSIVAKKELPFGHIIRFDDFDWVRPEDGLSPGSEEQLLGKSLSRKIRKGQIISLEDVN